MSYNQHFLPSYFSLCPPVCLSAHYSISLSIRLPVLSLCLSLRLSVETHTYIHLHERIPVFILIYSSTNLLLCPFINVFMDINIHSGEFVYLLIHSFAWFIHSSASLFIHSFIYLYFSSSHSSVHAFPFLDLSIYFPRFI